MSEIESIFYWITALLHALTFIMISTALIFKKSSAYTLGRWAFLLAFIMLTIFGIIRWISTGHPPFVTLFESMITSVWFILLIYHLFRIRYSPIGILILPASLISLILMGWSSSLPATASPLSAALNNVWLFIHASFATAGAASFLIAACLSVLFLAGEDKIKNMVTIARKIPEYARLPQTILNFLIFGLILWGVMIVSGSIWAHSAWGRYWAWDPIELWSLISWLLYGLVFHARITFKLSPRIFCWLTIIAAGAIVFSLWGVNYVYETIHVYG